MAKFRLVPFTNMPETGLLNPTQQEEAWHTQRSSTDSRPLDYLRDEYIRYLANEPVKYLLQIQLRSREEGDDSLWNPQMVK